MMKTTNILPYLIKAYLAWAEENGLTPQIRVDTALPGVSVPPGAANKDGWIVLTVSQRATSCFQVGETALSFDARFNQRSMPVSIPLNAIHSLFCRETSKENFLPSVEVTEILVGGVTPCEMLTWTFVSKSSAHNEVKAETPVPAPRRNHLRSVPN